MSPSLSIVIPAYNEAARIAGPLHTVIEYLNDSPWEGEVIVVDDGSTDDTAGTAERVFAEAGGRVAARVIRVEPNRGKGHAVRTGLLAARAPIALFSDADLSTPITETPKLVAPIRSGEYDVVFGSRAIDRNLIGVHQPWRREQSGRVFNLVMRLVTDLPYKDTQCGFKAFRMDVCRPVIEGGVIDRFGFDVELLFIARRAGLRLLERAVRWNDVEGSKVSFLAGLHGFGELREVRRNGRLGTYDEAVARTKELAETVPNRAPLRPGEQVNSESDVPPEIAQRRIEVGG